MINIKIVNIYLFTAHKRSLGQGNIFRSVCQEFCRQEGVPAPGGGCLVWGVPGLGGMVWGGVCSGGCLVWGDLLWGASGLGGLVRGCLVETRWDGYCCGTHPIGMHSSFQMQPSCHSADSTQTQTQTESEVF